jgi:hypothetical protein
MLLEGDVCDDLIWAYPELYTRIPGRAHGDNTVVYQNGEDNPKFEVLVTVVPL